MGAFVVIGVLVAVALGAGLFANRYVRPFANSEIQGVKLEALVGPIVTLTVLLLAFTLVTVFASFQRGRQAASDEARKVDYQFEMAGYLKGAERAQLMAATACYAAAVGSYEWETMAEGRTASEMSPWTRALGVGQRAVTAADEDASAVLSGLLTADRDRGEARSRRLTEARPTVPDALQYLLVLVACFAIFALATFTLPNVRRRVQLGVLSVLALVFVLFLGAMRDLDRPYDGLITVPPTDIERVAGDLAEDYAEEFPDVPLPCDETGRELEPG